MYEVDGVLRLAEFNKTFMVSSCSILHQFRKNLAADEQSSVIAL